MLETLKIVGAVLGIVTFLWKLWDIFGSYLYIDLSVDSDANGSVSAKTVVENKSAKGKRIDNAFLLIGPESENPITTFNSLATHAGLQTQATSTNEIAETHFENSIADDAGRIRIPLDFYYSENIGIGDERLTYRLKSIPRICPVEPDTPCDFSFGRWDATIGPHTIRLCWPSRRANKSLNRSGGWTRSFDIKVAGRRPVNTSVRR